MKYVEPKEGDLVKVRSTRFDYSTKTLLDDHYLGVVLKSNTVLYYRGMMRIYAFYAQRTFYVHKDDVEIV